MTLDQLRYFVEAANHQHVGRAARSIHISPSAISTAIAGLEREFGRQLFRKEGRNIVLTPDGERLRHEGRELLGQANSLSHFMSNRTKRLHGIYRLGASHYLAARLLGPSWAKIARNHPALHGELYSMNTADLLGSVLGGRLDFGLCFSPQQHPQLREYVIYRGELRLVVPTGHPVAALPRSKQLEALSRYPAVLHKSAPGVDICESHPMFDKFNIRPRVASLFDSDDIAIEGLLGSHAWSLLPDFVARRHKNRLALISRPKGWNAPYTIAAVVHSERQSDAIIEPFLEILKKQLKVSINH